MEHPHRQFGIADDIVDLINPPPFASPDDAQKYFRTLAQLAAAVPPSDGLDWISLGDAAYDRAEIQMGRVAKHAVRVLHHDRAYKEIARPGGARFIERNPFKPAHPMLAQTPDCVEADEGRVDFDKAEQHLEDLGLDEHDAVTGLALVLASSLLQPLEDLEDARRHSQRAALLDVERRAARREPTTHVQETTIDPADPVQDALMIDAEVSESTALVVPEAREEPAPPSKPIAAQPAEAQPQLFAAE